MNVIDFKSIITKYDLNLRFNSYKPVIDDTIQAATNWASLSDGTFSYIFDLSYIGNCEQSGEHMLTCSSRLQIHFAFTNEEITAQTIFDMVKDHYRYMLGFIKENIHFDMCSIAPDAFSIPMYYQDHIKEKIYKLKTQPLTKDEPGYGMLQVKTKIIKHYKVRFHSQYSRCCETVICL